MKSKPSASEYFAGASYLLVLLGFAASLALMLGGIYTWARGL